MNIKQKIARLKQQIRLRETADDGYYLSRQYKENTLSVQSRRLRPESPARPKTATSGGGLPASATASASRFASSAPRPVNAAIASFIVPPPESRKKGGVVEL